ncbi:MAG: penicillin acylase family protein [Gemmatimonadetes bacterium]|nr:penicillin acylase family protein [Gemmatimonadota bacterium]
MALARLILIRGLAAIVLAGGLYLGARPLGPLPPLGTFLDPANGVWAVARRTTLPADAHRTIPGLAAPVDIRYDDRAVPHIFAATEADAQRALGFVVAQDRLFQMELQTRATAGRLSEILGPQVLELDRQARRLGLAASAERAWAAMPKDSPTAMALVAYAEGVNAWIAGMRPADLPLEFQLLNARPMRWEPQYSIYLLRRMGWTLAYSTSEFRRERVASLVGYDAADALFPVNTPIVEPIEPGKGKYPRYDWKKLPPPGRRGGLALSGWADERMSGQSPSAADRGDAIGSNNWAVAPSRSANGHALLAGDPHLDLSLPSIWYEAHLVVGGGPSAHPPIRPSANPPTSLDVYGVTIPGAPAIVIGFNRDVAWTYTATEADVTDYYEERFDDPARPAAYFLDGKWVPLERRIESYQDQRGRPLATDTIYSTHRGPVTTVENRWISMRWAVPEANTELGALLAGAHARSADEWFRAASAWSAPGLSILVADRRGTISIRSAGRMPIRPAGGLGIFDGTKRASDWGGNLPVTRQPASRNPARGFVSSNNQQPLDPRANPAYLGSNWETPWRAMRINGLLRDDAKVTMEAMRRWQTDPGSARADFFVPYFLAAAGPLFSPDGRVRGSAGPDVGDPTTRQTAELLAQWDRRYTKDNTRAVLFEQAMDRLATLTWDELEDSTGRRNATPRDVILAELLQDSNSVWWDRRSITGVRERRDAILRLALSGALAETKKRYGEPDAGGWRWDQVQHANIYHLLRLRALSALEIPIQGGRATLNPSSGEGTQGASWRMVVDLGDSITAWGIYPGGQSGNPVSPRYLDRLPKWVEGELDTLRVPRAAADLAGLTSARLTLTGAP